MNHKVAERYTELARSIALGLDQNFQHVSIILHKRQIVSIGTNDQTKTHPQTLKMGVEYLFETPHSELRALMGTKHRKHLTLLNYRFNRLGELRLSRPCSRCIPWCLTVFDKIFYTTNSGIERLT